MRAQYDGDWDSLCEDDEFDADGGQCLEDAWGHDYLWERVLPKWMTFGLVPPVRCTGDGRPWGLDPSGDGPGREG